MRKETNMTSSEGESTTITYSKETVKPHLKTNFCLGVSRHFSVFIRQLQKKESNALYVFTLPFCISFRFYLTLLLL